MRSFTFKSFATATVLVATVCHSHAATIVEYKFDSATVAPTDVSGAITATDYDPRQAEIQAAFPIAAAGQFHTGPSGSTLSPGVEPNGGVYFRAIDTPTITDPVGDTNVFFHTFSFEVTGLASGESLNLTDALLVYAPQTVGQQGVFADQYYKAGLYSDSTGLVDGADELGFVTAVGPVEATEFHFSTIDLTSGNSVAGSAFADLVNGDTVSFRVYFADSWNSLNSAPANYIHRLTEVTINGEVVGVPEPTSITLLGMLGAAMTAIGRRRSY